MVGAQQAAPLQRQDGKSRRAWYEEVHAIEALEQLAIHYEHRAREPHRAAEYARAARTEVRRALRLGLIDPSRGRKLQGRLDHRLARLERKGGQIGRLLERMAGAPAGRPGESNPGSS